MSATMPKLEVFPCVTTSTNVVEKETTNKQTVTSLKVDQVLVPMNILQLESPILDSNNHSSSFFINKNNVAKLNWWNTPSHPLLLNQTIEDAVAQKVSQSDSKCCLSSSMGINIHPIPSETKHSTNLEYLHVASEDDPGNHGRESTTQHSHNNKFHHRDHEQRVLSLESIKQIKSPKKNLIENLKNQENEEQLSYASQRLITECKPCVAVLNPNEEDEMKVTGYCRSLGRTFLCWLCICLTGGLLRLVLYWWGHWYLMATHKQCSLEEAEMVLVQEDYQGKHKTFYVKKIQILKVSALKYPTNLKKKFIRKQKPIDLSHYASDVGELNDDNLHLTAHFSSAHFKKNKSLRIFICKQLRYVWNTQTQSFSKLRGLDENICCSYFYQQKGLSRLEQLSRRLVYGENKITVPYNDVMSLLCQEVLNPFYVFQIFSVTLWFLYEYYYYACVIVLMSVIGIVMSILQTKKNQNALRETVENSSSALVLREEGSVQELPTQCLVPGDIIEIPSDGCTMQCDAVLLSGNCIIDESMLTGESVPVTKTPLPMKRDTIFDKKEHARHTIFCGTKVIQTRYIGSEKVLAIVINTGNITAKGGLIRSILYPPPVDYKFEQDSYKIVECLAVIALVGFVYTLVTKVRRDISTVKTVVESLDLITIVVPPALPAAMTVGRFYAQKRLERKKIHCISPRSINVAGSIDCCCFDKTGTLTEDGLDMWGVVPKSATNQFQMPIKHIERLPSDNFLFGMATCHSITIMNGKIMGDPLDLKMFESTGWILEDPKDIPDNQKYGLIHPTIVRYPKKDKASTKIEKRQSSFDDLLADVGLFNCESSNDHGIVREFPFTSTLQRMSVITRRLSEKNFNVYCKGSPEMLQLLCDPHTLPENFSQQLAVFAKKGYRIIAMAHKPLSCKLNYTKIMRLARENVEADLNFLGFVVLENRLKPETMQVIHSLTSANIRSIMVTGDNILTAVSVARDCGIVQPTQAVVTVNVRNRKESQLSIMQSKHNYEIYYTLEFGSSEFEEKAFRENGNFLSNERKEEEKNNGDCDNYCKKINGDYLSQKSISSTFPKSSSLTSVQTCETWTHHDVELGLYSPMEHKTESKDTDQNFNNSWRRNYCFAIVGKTWQIVREHFPDELQSFITRGTIFARMSPDQKQALITELQSIGYCVAMCGDGANDCGALKVAHAGISLSETESSIASPFTSRNPTIACVPSVIKEGRAALATSFGVFKYMAAYSMVQFISVMILYSIDCNLTDKQFLYIDLGLITVFAFFFGQSEAYDGSLAKQVPLSSLLSLAPLASIALNLLVVVAFQVTAWWHLHQQSWFVPFVFKDENHLGCFENYTIFAISSFQYIILAFVFSKGAPYRKPIYNNVPFCTALGANLCIVIYLILYPEDWVINFFELILPPVYDFRFWMIIYGLLNFIAHFFVESVIVEYFLFAKFQARRDQNMRTSKLKYRQVEYELQYSHDWPKIADKFEIYEETPEEASPTYIEIKAEQNFASVNLENNALNSFFELNSSKASKITQSTKLDQLDFTSPDYINNLKDS